MKKLITLIFFVCLLQTSIAAEPATNIYKNNFLSVNTPSGYEYDTNPDFYKEENFVVKSKTSYLHQISFKKLNKTGDSQISSIIIRIVSTFNKDTKIVTNSVIEGYMSNPISKKDNIKIGINNVTRVKSKYAPGNGDVTDYLYMYESNGAVVWVNAIYIEAKEEDAINLDKIAIDMIKSLKLLAPIDK